MSNFARTTGEQTARPGGCCSGHEQSKPALAPPGAATAEAGVNATDCIPDATAPCVPAQASSSRSATVVRSTRSIADSVSVASAITVYPCPCWKYSKDGFLSPPMFASSRTRSIATGACGRTYAMFSA